MVDYLIDLQVSINKIVHNLVLTEDGNAFTLETDSSSHEHIDNQSVTINQSYISANPLQDTARVSLQQLVVFKDKNMGEKAHDRIKDIGVTGNGMIYTNEKGEVLIGLTAEECEKHKID